MTSPFVYFVSLVKFNDKTVCCLAINACQDSNQQINDSHLLRMADFARPVTCFVCGFFSVQVLEVIGGQWWSVN